MEQTAKRHRRMNLLIFLMPFLAVVFCIGIGRYHITPLESLKILISPFTGMEADAQAWSVIFRVRLPRIQNGPPLLPKAKHRLHTSWPAGQPQRSQPR